MSTKFEELCQALLVERYCYPLFGQSAPDRDVGGPPTADAGVEPVHEKDRRGGRRQGRRPGRGEAR